MLTLHNLAKSKSKKRKKRVGRGNASGHGTYSTRGIKGQRARSGGRKSLKMKSIRRMALSVPKARGFKRYSDNAQIINLSDLNNFAENDKVNKEILFKKKLVDNKNDKVKILGRGELKIKGLNIEECELSKTTKEQIEKIGGKISL
ncbi:MAG: 50S ribosomal protein L15 [bacterium]